MRVLFYGTPEFAVPSLRALIGEGFDVVGVVTRPDKPTGRHRSTPSPSPVKVAALAEDLPVLQPETPSSDAFVETVRGLAPDCGVVVAYGHILPERLLDVPLLGHVNVHASLLPHLRGAAPIERAVRAIRTSFASPAATRLRAAGKRTQSTASTVPASFQTP